MQRTRTGKRLELSARDLEIFRSMARYRYLSSAYIHAFVGGASQTRFKERLGDLFHEGYLDRPERQWELANCRHRPVVHELGAGAQRILNEQGIVEEPRTWLGSSAQRQFLHALLICEVLASIELGVRSTSGLRIIPWPEILAKAPSETRAMAQPFRFELSGLKGGLIPDGFFGLEYRDGEKKAYRFFALEIDRGTMPIGRTDPRQTSYLAKLAAYRQIIERRLYKTQLGLPNLFVLSVICGQSRCAEIVRQCDPEHPTNQWLFFKAISTSLPREPLTALLSESWSRPHLAPFCIDR